LLKTSNFRRFLKNRPASYDLLRLLKVEKEPKTRKNISRQLYA